MWVQISTINGKNSNLVVNEKQAWVSFLCSFYQSRLPSLSFPLIPLQWPDAYLIDAGHD
jgi:hypothetical protein